MKFDIEVGFMYRKIVRQELTNSKNRIEFDYLNSKVLFTENGNLLSSIFHFEVTNLPLSAESRMRKWETQIRKVIG